MSYPAKVGWPKMSLFKYSPLGYFLWLKPFFLRNNQTISEWTISACWWISRWLITIVTWFSFVTVNNTWGSNLWFVTNVAGTKFVLVSRRSSVVLDSPFVWIVAEVFVWKKSNIKNNCLCNVLSFYLTKSNSISILILIQYLEF